jgi:hypothetical protein
VTAFPVGTSLLLWESLLFPPFESPSSVVWQQCKESLGNLVNAFNKLPSFAVFREEKQFLNVIHAIIIAMKVSKFLLLQKLLALQPSLTLCLASKEDYFHKVAGPLLAINFCSRQFGHHQRQSLPMMVMIFSKNSMHELFGLGLH